MAKKQETGLYCVYFQYKKLEDQIPQIIYRGSKAQCQKHIEEYNRLSPERYRCVLYLDTFSTVNGRIVELKKKYGVVDEE